MNIVPNVKVTEDINSSLRENVAEGKDSRIIADKFLESWEHKRELVSQEDTLQKFYDLLVTWKIETQYLSSMQEIVSNPSYLRIIALGYDALPFIFSEMKREPAWWFTSLRAITGANPILPEHTGNLKAMTQDWLDWGEQNGLLP